jgi:hypothetical protein
MPFTITQSIEFPKVTCSDLELALFQAGSKNGFQSSMKDINKKIIEINPYKEKEFVEDRLIILKKFGIPFATSHVSHTSSDVGRLVIQYNFIVESKIKKYLRDVSDYLQENQ